MTDPSPTTHDRPRGAALATPAPSPTILPTVRPPTFRPPACPLADAPASNGDAAAPTDHAARAAALVPAQLLQPGEVIILALKPSPWFIVLEPLTTLVAIVFVGLLALWLAANGILPFPQRDITLSVLAALAVRLFWQFLEWLSRAYILTDRRILSVAGVLRVTVFETALTRVQHTHIVFTVRERLVGLGSLLFATAGTATLETVWRMIARPLDVHRKVVQTLERYGR